MANDATSVRSVCRAGGSPIEQSRRRARRTRTVAWLLKLNAYFGASIAHFSRFAAHGRVEILGVQPMA